MKYILLYLFTLSAPLARGETFQHFSTSFPLGISKKDILAKAPSGLAAPCEVIPIDQTARCESIILLNRPDRFAGRFYVVNDKLAAMMLARLPAPGATKDTNETQYISSRKQLTSFLALRGDKSLNSKEVKVNEFEFNKPNQVALVVSSDSGLELWIVDKSIFNPRSFFLEPTAENKDKMLKSKKMIDAQLQQLKKTEQGAAANP